MHKILFIAPDTGAGPVDSLIAAVTASRFHVGRLRLDRDAQAIDALCDLFDGRPPDIVVADLTSSDTCLPLRHAMRLLSRAWGDVPNPVRVGLFTSDHLRDSTWMADVDEFLLPPYNAPELLARLELQLFRKRNTASIDRITMEDIRIELSGSRVFDDVGEQIPLTPREFDLLRFLATQRGKFFARDRLLDLVWGLNFDGGERTVDIHVRRLRAKLPARAAALLETRRGVGYGFVSA